MTASAEPTWYYENFEISGSAVADIAAWHGLDVYPAATLFSRRRFKQCGARRFADALPAGAAN